MSEGGIIALFATHTLTVLAIAGWILTHELRCEKRWLAFLKQHSRVMQALGLKAIAGEETDE